MSSNIRHIRQKAPELSQKARPSGDKLTRNIAIATLALLAVVGIRDGLPQGSGLLQTMQQAVESEWDQNVGKLTYVNSSLMDSIQVFGSQKSDPLVCPVTASAVQAWTADTPYLVYEHAGNVFSAAEGEVTQIAHDDASRFILLLQHSGGVTTCYYGLDECYVQEGDPVTAETLLGTSGGSFAFEVSKNGKAIDCSGLLRSRESTK